VNDLLKMAVKGHGGLQRREQISRFRAAAPITVDVANLTYS
jgi:hypothetical protein